MRFEWIARGLILARVELLGSRLNMVPAMWEGKLIRALQEVQGPDSLMAAARGVVRPTRWTGPDLREAMRSLGPSDDAWPYQEECVWRGGPIPIQAFSDEEWLALCKSAILKPTDAG